MNIIEIIISLAFDVTNMESVNNTPGANTRTYIRITALQTFFLIKHIDEMIQFCIYLSFLMKFKQYL